MQESQGFIRAFQYKLRTVVLKLPLMQIPVTDVIAVMSKGMGPKQDGSDVSPFLVYEETDHRIN